MTNVLHHVPHQEEVDETEAASPVLTVELESTGSRCVLTMSGVLDKTSIAAVEAQIDQIGCSACEYVELDLAGLTTLDSVGTRVLDGLDGYVRALGARLTISGASGQVAEALRTTRFYVVDTQSSVGVRPPGGYPHHFSSRPDDRPFRSPNFSTPGRRRVRYRIPAAGAAPSSWVG